MRCFLMHFLRFLHISGVILTNEQKRMFVFAILKGVMVGIWGEKCVKLERIRILCELI